jgi:hypothetical protein
MQQVHNVRFRFSNGFGRTSLRVGLKERREFKLAMTEDSRHSILSMLDFPRTGTVPVSVRLPQLSSTR